MKQHYHVELAKITRILDRAKETGNQRKGKRYINALMKWSRRAARANSALRKPCPRKDWHFSYNKIAKELV